MDKVVAFLESEELRMRSSVLAEEVMIKGKKDVKTVTVRYFTGKKSRLTL